MAVGIEAEEVAEGLDGDDRAGDGIIFGNDRLKKPLQGFPGAAAQIGKKTTIIEKIPAEDLRDAGDEMPVGNFLGYVVAQSLPELDHPFVMTGWTETPVLVGEGQKVLMVAVFAFHTGKAVVENSAIQILDN